MLYSKPCEYAFRAMTWLATHEFGRAQQIAKEERLPAFFLAKILKELAAKKVLNSSRGRKGGFSLSRPAEQITLEEIVSALDGLEDLRRCAIGWARCSDDKPCSLHNRFKPIRERVHDYLKTTTISHLVTAEAVRKGLKKKE